jgi:hypothetical protein
MDDDRSIDRCRNGNPLRNGLSVFGCRRQLLKPPFCRYFAIAVINVGANGGPWNGAPV